MFKEDVLKSTLKTRLIGTCTVSNVRCFFFARSGVGPFAGGKAFTECEQNSPFHDPDDDPDDDPWMTLR